MPRVLAEASGLPVNGDFESGYGETPAEVGETIRRTIDAGVAGCSVEDKDQGSGGLYPLDEALRRFSAAKEAAIKAGTDFVLTGRCEVFLAKFQGDPLQEAVRRLKAYEAAGADVVYAPGVTTEEEVRAIVEAVKVPVNVIGGLGGISNDFRCAGEARREAHLDRLRSRQGGARRVPESRARTRRPQSGV